ncbi:serine/threonine-protein phosphatase 6 regulatory subunit 3-like isoform X1 [Iris pallida]|uniref:Serine/threonine-protein phosphatase 6 regulatory subunit 3-like isoform X1 n=1 Tax=Iris pallida TaxID=29817 RepID=A0AAX6GC16_IRIPA|nr:serine/threonine-protein phosphatase 6 regulatory subunit 3-like isoform X1 [Iris pallida]
MFWRMTGFSAASPVETIMDKENFTLEELLDEDEIIQECKASNNRLISYLRERAQLEQLLRYILDEAPEDAEKKRIFKFPFIACEIFTCEVDAILKTLVEDEELMNLLFSFLRPDRPHNSSSAGYFSKVVMCLYSRKTMHLMSYIQGHQDIFHQLVDLIGITSVMEVLIRLIGADENMSSNYADTTEWLKDTELLEMIVDRFGSSDSPEVHANAAETLCAIIRCAPPGFAAKICSQSFVGRLFCHATEGSRPKSVLVNSLSVCISLLDPKRSISASFNLYRSRLSHGSLVAANAETVNGMLENLGDLLKLLDVSTTKHTLPTTYGDLKPPLGKHRLKIVEFISVLLTIGSEDAEKELVQQGVIKNVLDLFFEYPFNNFLHHYVESIMVSCLESKSTLLVEHVLQDCDILSKIMVAEKQPLLLTDCSKPTTAAEGRAPPRIGNLGHVIRIANKLVELGNKNSLIHTHLQKNNEWADWHANVLLKRNAIENIYQWTCGRPNALQDRFRDSDDEDLQNRDYDVATLANNLIQVFQYGNYNNVDMQEAGSLEPDDEDAYFDDESTEVVISSLRLGMGDDQDSTSLFTNSNWFANEEDRTSDDHSADSSSSPSTSTGHINEVIVGEEDLTNSALCSQVSDVNTNPEEARRTQGLVNDSVEESQELGQARCSRNNGEDPPECFEWRETSDSSEVPLLGPPAAFPYGEPEAGKAEGNLEGTSVGEEDEGGSPGPRIIDPNVSSESENRNQCTDPPIKPEPSNRDDNAEISDNIDGNTIIEEAKQQK